MVYSQTTVSSEIFTAPTKKPTTLKLLDPYTHNVIAADHLQTGRFTKWLYFILF